MRFNRQTLNRQSFRNLRKAGLIDKRGNLTQRGIKFLKDNKEQIFDKSEEIKEEK